MSDKHKPMSQPKFAELLGASRQIIAEIEIGIKRLTPNIARRIRSCTGCMIFSADEEIRAPDWENLPLQDFAGRPYAPASYREWCSWKVALDASGDAYRGNFLGEAIDILSSALRRVDEGAPMERRNSKLVNFWNRIPDVLLDFLGEPAVAAEVERELVRRFGEKGGENFFTFLRCLHGVGLPVEGEFAPFREHWKGGPHDYLASRTVHSIIHSMCTFRKWRGGETRTETKRNSLVVAC
jgi:transcriptional regulator with XRE-family HTH domain